MNWDQYYLNICKEVGKKSKCHSRQIGSILVKDKIILSTGYNGPARGVPECRERLFMDKLVNSKLKEKYTDEELNELYKIKTCPRKPLGYGSGEGLEWCPAVHSEKNCLLSAARAGISTLGATIYINANISSCTQCFSACVNAGIKEIVVVKNNIYDVSLNWVMTFTDLQIREFKL